MCHRFCGVEAVCVDPVSQWHILMTSSGPSHYSALSSSSLHWGQPHTTKGCKASSSLLRGARDGPSVDGILRDFWKSGKPNTPSKGTYHLHHTQTHTFTWSSGFQPIKKKPYRASSIVRGLHTRTSPAVWSWPSEPGVSFHTDKSVCNGEDLSRAARRGKKNEGRAQGRSRSQP